MKDVKRWRTYKAVEQENREVLKELSKLSEYCAQFDIYFQAVQLATGPAWQFPGYFLNRREKMEEYKATIAERMEAWNNSIEALKKERQEL